MTSADWLGAFGVFLILLAYVLSITNKINIKSKMYVFLNFIGASLACLASILINYVPFIILEAVWALVSLIALIKILNHQLK